MKLIRRKRQQDTLMRLVIGGLEIVNGLSALGGGLALLLGTYKDGVLIEAGGQARFPLQWLQDTPFSDYTVPALILTGVGGNSLIGAALVFTGRDEGLPVSFVAGLALSGFIVGEVILLKQPISQVEVLYFGLGMLIAGLAASFWITRDRRHRMYVKHTSGSVRMNTFTSRQRRYPS